MLPSQFDRDNLDNWDGADHARDDDDISSLPEDAQELYRQLTREGAPSRERLARIDQRLQERITQLSATRLAIAPESQPEPESEPRTSVSAPRSALPRSPTAEPLVRRAPRYPATRRWVATLATAAVVLAFAAVFALNVGHRIASNTSSHQTPTGVASPTSEPTDANWTDLTQLDYSTSFSANGFPAVAPSNPQVVYETMAQSAHRPGPATLRATSNGGVTWRTLPTPVPADHISWASIVVSPLDPQTVFLTVQDTTVADCPPSSEVNGPGGGIDISSCEIDYSSFDGGAHWTLTAPTLPVAYGTLSGLFSAGGSIRAEGGYALSAQGQRLFTGASYSCHGAQGWACGRLVTSDNGGRTWRFADLPLLAGGAADLCDFAASGFSADLYAVTAPTTCDFRQQAALTLWHSTDAGATWVKVGQLATPNEAGLALAHDDATGATLLYLEQPVTTSFTKDKIGDSIPVFSHALRDVKVSTDGGATWQSAPTAGISSDDTLYLESGLIGPSLLGSLSDGSIVIEVIPSSTADAVGNFQGGDLYAWKPGDSGWHPIGSVSAEMDGLLVVPTSSGDGDTVYAFLTSRNDTDTFTILRKHVAG